jgi:hypothetical protein
MCESFLSFTLAARDLHFDLLVSSAANLSCFETLLEPLFSVSGPLDTECFVSRQSNPSARRLVQYRLTFPDGILYCWLALTPRRAGRASATEMEMGWPNIDLCQTRKWMVVGQLETTIRSPLEAPLSRTPNGRPNLSERRNKQREKK